MVKSGLRLALAASILIAATQAVQVSPLGNGISGGGADGVTGDAVQSVSAAGAEAGNAVKRRPVSYQFNAPSAQALMAIGVAIMTSPEAFRGAFSR